MDPMNNPTPTPNPMPEQPVAPAQPMSPVQPMPPVQPTQPVMPMQQPVAPAAPVNPVINPAAGAAPVQPMNPVFAPTGGGLVGATDPITMPTPPKAPDPVEEELKAPFKAAGPVPGSIGSAISVPAEGNTAPVGAPVPMQGGAMGHTPSVSFNDPAMSNAPSATPAPAKKKVSKNTLILLSVVAGIIVVVLAVVLVMQLTAGN